MIKEGNIGKKKISWALFAINLLLLVGLSVFAFRKPLFNWDMLGYMAVVLKMDGLDQRKIHEEVYHSAERNLPPAAFAELTKKENAYRKQMYESADSFQRQLPFYVVKPLYTVLVYFFYRIGFSLPSATLMPSVLAFVLIGAVLFYWLSNYLTPVYSLLASMLFMSSSFMMYVARLSTPDALSALFLFSGFYFVVEKRSGISILTFFVLAILCRIDNILISVTVLSLLYFSKKGNIRPQFSHYSSALLLMAAAYFVSSWSVRAYGWSASFYPGFFKMISPYYGEQNGSIRDYLSLWSEKFQAGLLYSHLALFLLLIALVFAKVKSYKIRALSFDELLLLVVVGIIALRFVLFPDISDRFYISFYLLFFVILVKKFFVSESKRDFVL